MKPEAFTVADVLGDAAKRIMGALNLDARTARLEARVLAAHVLKVAPSWLIAHDTDPINAGALGVFCALLERRLAGEPIAYLTGVREFYGYAFEVTPDVLIPRPETELLVERALSQIPPDAAFNVLELGCGSGCVAISLALQRPRARITAVDCSVAALTLARRNAMRLNTQVEFLSSDWYVGLVGRQFDMIVSNPPYVAANDPHLGRGDVRFEPMGAFIAGIAGLDALRVIIKSAHLYLRARGSLILEHGYDQAKQVQALLELAGMTPIETWHDLSGVARISSARLSG